MYASAGKAVTDHLHPPMFIRTSSNTSSKLYPELQFQVGPVEDYAAKLQQLPELGRRDDSSCCFYTASCTL